MELVIKIFTLIGAISTVGGSSWALMGVYSWAQGRKNRDKQAQDDGLEAIILGGAVAAVAGSIVATIVTQIQGIAF